VQRGTVGITVHRDGADPEIPTRPKYTDRDLTPIRNENFLDPRHNSLRFVGILDYFIKNRLACGQHSTDVRQTEPTV